MSATLTSAGGHAVAARGESIARATLRELRRALTLVAASDEARALRAASAPGVGIESPLAEWLYANWWAAPSGAAPPPRRLAASAAFPRVGLLDSARRRLAGTSPDWIVLAVAAEAVTLVAARPPASAPPGHRRIDLRRIVGSSRPGCPPAPGDLVSISRGASGWDRSTGWWWAHSGDSVPEGALDRWYVHARSPEASAALLAPLLSAFDDAGSVFSLKCLPSPAGYGRPDAFVVYTPRPLRGRLGAALRQRAGAVAPHVAASVPPTTRRILPGIGMSEDPDDGTSFGQLRTAQVAAIAVDTRADAAAPALRAAAGAAGIDLERPWRAGS